MMKEEIRKLAEDYIDSCTKKSGFVILAEGLKGDFIDLFVAGFMKCLEINKPVEWHDLEKDPTDLPKGYKTMCICLSDFGSKYEPVPRVCVGYCDSLGWSDYMGSSLYSTVRYWCELPRN